MIALIVYYAQNYAGIYTWCKPMKYHCYQWIYLDFCRSRQVQKTSLRFDYICKFVCYRSLKVVFNNDG